MSALTLLSRDGCGLCEEFLEAFAAACPDLLPRLLVADVDSRPGWAGRWGALIPVLIDEDGTVICETFFDETALRAALAEGAAR
ncbi:glutaredoxin family protein [Nevskia sp.]|uniref:glutaredoxin family protein n=1 Tax=Nevskia sp. TaxID=1929292 RepID=UPI0025F567B8|nr:glutaredoxin family protein [Nevskia sp.]